MKRQMFIWMLLTLTLTGILSAQTAPTDSISEFLNKKQNEGVNKSAIETQAQSYFEAIINRDAEGIFRFMNPVYASKFTSKAKALDMIRDEFKLMDSDGLKIISVKIKPGAQLSSNNSAPQKIALKVEFTYGADSKEPITVDGELTPVMVNNTWYFYHRNYYLNSLQAYGLVRAVEEDPPADNQTGNDSNPYSAGVISGRAITLPQPVYPKAAQAVGASGPVIVSLVVNEEGNVISADAVSGHVLLQPAAVEAAKNAKFQPLIVGGKPLKYRGLVTYIFSK